MQKVVIVHWVHRFNIVRELPDVGNGPSTVTYNHEETREIDGSDVLWLFQQGYDVMLTHRSGTAILAIDERGRHMGQR